MVKAYLFIALISQFTPVRAQLYDSSIIDLDSLLTKGKSGTDFHASLNYSRLNSDSAKKKNIKKITAALFAYTGVTYFFYRSLDSKIQIASQKNKSSVKTSISNSVSWLGLGRTQSIGLGTAAAFSFLANKKKLQKTVIIWGGSLVLNSIITDQLKKTFQRHRPSTGDTYNVFDWRGGPKLNKSFPSAHTSNAFTTATVFSTMYKENKWVPPVAYGLATLVGISRIYDNGHWSSDVLAGAAVGFLSAKLMFHIYKWAGKKVTFLPNVGTTYSSISVICNL